MECLIVQWSRHCTHMEAVGVHGSWRVAMVWELLGPHRMSGTAGSSQDEWAVVVGMLANW